MVNNRASKCNHTAVGYTYTRTDQKLLHKTEISYTDALLSGLLRKPPIEEQQFLPHVHWNSYSRIGAK